MDINNEELSLSWYSFLCKVVGSEDVVRTRKRIFNALDSANYSYKHQCFLITSGSKAEGLNDPSSDCDLIYVLKWFLVYENTEDLINEKQNRYTPIRLIMDTNDTKPGYTRLKLYDRNNLSVNVRLCHKIGNEVFLSSELFRGLSFDPSTYITHGPCLQLSCGFVDLVYSLHCEKWIMQADDWIHRSRSSWPHNKLIDKILQYGVLFVPVGCKNSPRQDLEFRISFNVAERILVHSFTHVQLLCYAWLKTILNHFIKPQYGDLLCSYFLKTIMFWVSEETMESTWNPHNLPECCDLCFKRLVFCVTYKTCLHYFIPDLNLFEDRFSKSEHDSLTGTLQSLYTFLFNPFNFEIHQVSRINYLSVSALPSVLLAGTFGKTSLDIFEGEPMMRLVRSVFCSLFCYEKEMYALILSQLIQQVAQNIPIDETNHVINKQRYRNYQNCFNHLLQGLHHDAVSGWLLLASFLYTCNKYQQCLHVLNYCLHKCSPDKILLQKNIDIKLQHEFNIEIQLHINNAFQRTCKRRLLDLVRFKEHSFIIPTEFSGLVEKTFPPVVFAHFLSCMCLRRLNRNRDKLNSLRDLETTVKDMYFIPSDLLEISDKCIAVARELLV